MSSRTTGRTRFAFALEAELGGQKLWLDYYVTSQSGGGVTLAARLLQNDLTVLRREVDRLARSVTVTRRITAPKAKPPDSTNRPHSQKPPRPRTSDLFPGTRGLPALGPPGFPREGPMIVPAISDRKLATGCFSATAP